MSGAFIRMQWREGHRWREPRGARKPPVFGNLPVETLPSHHEILGRPRGRRGVSRRAGSAGNEASEKAAGIGWALRGTWWLSAELRRAIVAFWKAWRRGAHCLRETPRR